MNFTFLCISPCSKKDFCKAPFYDEILKEKGVPEFVPEGEGRKEKEKEIEISEISILIYSVHKGLKKGMTKKAFDNYNKAIVLVKKSFGTKNAVLGDIYKDLGTLCQVQGRYESAQVYLEIAANMHQTAWNKEHEKVFRACLILSLCYFLKNDFN